MPKWIETWWHQYEFGYNQDSYGGWFTNNARVLTTPQDRLKSAFESMSNYCNEHQYTIKAILPLTTALASWDYSTHTNGINNYAYAWGYGYGLTQIVGFTVLLQKEEEVSQEEYARRVRKQDAIKILEQSRKHLSEAEKRIALVLNADDEIIEKKKLFGGFKYVLMEKEYSSHEEALAVLDQHNAAGEQVRRECEILRATIAQLEHELAELDKV